MFIHRNLLASLLHRLTRAADDPGGAPVLTPPAPSPTPTLSPAIPAPPPPAPAPSAKFWEGFAEDLKGSHSITKFSDPEALARSYLKLETARGLPPERVLTLPSAEDAAKPGAYADIYRALGVPDTPEAYGVSVPETAPEVVRGFAADLPKELHGLGVTKPAMDKLVEVMNRHAEGAVKAENDRAEADRAAVKTFLQKEFGDNAEAAAKDMTELIMAHAGGDATDPAVAAAHAALRAEINESLGKMPTFIKFMADLVNQRREGGPTPAGDRGGATVIRSASDAQAAKNAFFADAVKMAAWRDGSHPAHKAALAEMNAINKAALDIRRAGKK